MILALVNRPLVEKAGVTGPSFNLADLANLAGLSGFGATTRKPAFNFVSTTPALNFNLADLANLAGLAGLGDLAGLGTTKTTTKSSGFNIGNLENFASFLSGGGTNSNTNSNSNINSILSLLNLLNGGQSSSLSALTPFLGLLPLDQLFPNNDPTANLGLITSLPQILSLIQSFSNFKFPASNVN